MKKKKTKAAKTVSANAKRWAAPNPEQDKVALKAHYDQMVATDGDVTEPDEDGTATTSGLTTDDLDKIGELAKALKKQKK